MGVGYSSNSIEQKEKNSGEYMMNYEATYLEICTHIWWPIDRASFLWASIE
jgi:hypothetical protein